MARILGPRICLPPLTSGVHMLVTPIEPIEDVAVLAGATATRGLRDVDALTHRLYNPVWSLGQAQ